MALRPIGLSLALAALTIAAGLAVRFAPLHLPAKVVKYGGSMLWALTIYWLVTTITPRRAIPSAALIACLLATAVECLKLYRNSTLDAFRLTLPGILLLGRFFSLWDIAAYWIAIAAGSLLDATLRSSLSKRVSPP